MKINLQMKLRSLISKLLVMKREITWVFLKREPKHERALPVGLEEARAMLREGW